MTITTAPPELPASPQVRAWAAWAAYWVNWLLGLAAAVIGTLVSLYAAGQLAWKPPIWLCVAGIVASVITMGTPGIASLPSLLVRPAAPSSPSTKDDSVGRSSSTPLAGAVLIFMLAPVSACTGNPYLDAYRRISDARAVAAAAESTLSAVCRAKADTCRGAHPADRPGYLACVKACDQGLDAVVRYVRPGVNSGITLAVASVRLAEASRGKVAVMDYLLPIACALAQTMDQWIHLLPPAVAAPCRIIAGLAQGTTCQSRASPAAAPPAAATPAGAP